MIYVYGMLVFLSGYFLCYREPRNAEKYKVVPTDKIMRLIAFPVICLCKIPVAGKLIKKDVKSISLMKMCILIYLMCSFFPTYIFGVLDDVNTVTAIWCVMGMFMLTITSIVYFIYDIIKERKWILFKAMAIIFSFLGTVIMLAMCRSALLICPLYVLLTMIPTGIMMVVVLATSVVEIIS